MRLDRHGRSGEKGSALIIALVFITTISLIVSAILSFTDVGLRASKSYNFKGRARSSYAAEGAIATAIKRYSTAGPCDNFTAPLVEGSSGPIPVNDQGVIVRCEGPAPAASRGTQPVNSLLSLGEDGGDGITSTQELRLLGDVFSNTNVDAKATMVVQGEVSAVGDCTGPIQTAPPTSRRCANSVPPEPADTSRGRDPRYTPATAVVPVRQQVPPCPAGGLVTLPPGYYDDADDLTALTGSPSCNDKVVWFQPGTYYFDLGFGGGSSTWIVDNPSVVVVGGTPTPPPLAVPGSCETNGPGVQLIAGGSTRLDVRRGRMELCATPSATDQQIALFGLGPERPSHTLESTDIISTGFTSAVNAQTIEETPVAAATAALRSAATPPLTTASVAFEAFRPGVPSGSVIEGVSLRVKHQEDVDPVDVTVTADYPGSACGPAAPPTAPQMLAASPGMMADDAIDLVVACGPIRPEDFAGLAVTYAATLAPGGATADLQVDGVVVEVTYRTPVTGKPTAVLGSPGFTNPAAALEIGEQPDRLTADSALSSAGTISASITLAGMGEPPLPTSATIKSAVLRVAHRDEGDTGSPTLTVPFGSGTCTLTLPRRPDGITDDRVDLEACDPGPVTPAQLRGLTATFTAALNTGGTAALSRLDGIWLEVVSSGATGSPPAAVRRAAEASSTSSGPSSAVFAPAVAAKAIGEAPLSTADANLSGPANTAALTVSGFNNAVPLPSGSKISSARLRVAHQEDANVASVGVATTFPGGTCLPEVIPNSEALASDDGVANLALCGLTSPERLTDLTATYTATRKTVTTTQVPATATVDGGFPDAQLKGRSIDDDSAGATLATSGPTTASALVTGFEVPPSPPAGLTLDTATLRIKHQDDGDVGAVTAAVAFMGTTCPVTPQPLTVRPGEPIEDSINLQACGLTDPAQLTGPEGLGVTYKVDLAPGDAKSAVDKLNGVVLDITYRPAAVAKLDGIELDIVFQPPTFRPLCPATAGCDLVKVAPATPADTATRFVVGGTIYAPSAGVDISMYGLDAQVLRRGLIARSIRLGLQPKDGYKRPTAAIPPEIVTFTAYPDMTLNPTTVVPPTTGFRDPDAAKALREAPPAVPTAVADLGATNPTTASLGLSGYQTGLPASAGFDSAVLRVRHQDVGNTVKITVKSGNTTCIIQDLAPSPGMGEDQVDLARRRGSPPECDLDNKAKLAAVTIIYDVALGPAATTASAKLDGITLEILSGPLVRADVTFERAKATVEAWNVLR